MFVFVGPSQSIVQSRCAERYTEYMLTMNATDARNNIGKLWDKAAKEPVTIESAGKPVAVVLSPEAYSKLVRGRKPRKAGTMRHIFAGVDVNALLATPIDDVFVEYM